jgi:hypothetical protein
MKSLLVLSATTALALSQQATYGYDYCSLSHSAHVLDRIDQEVMPIMSKFDVIMRQTCPFHYSNMGLLRDQVQSFTQGSNRAKSECQKCKKSFKSSDYLEYHMKMAHFGKKDMWSVDHPVCLSDYCDVFECPEQGDKLLRHQVFMDRDYNYEGKPKSS